MSIRIDKEFESLIPPLSADEFQQLEENCVRDGIIRDPLIVWPQDDGSDLLIDGHNRWKIVAKHGGLPFKTTPMEFKDRDEVALWIINNQLGKRNLPLYDKVKLEDKKKGILAAQAKVKKASGKADLTKKSWEGTDRQRHRENETDYKIAKAAGTSEDTVRKVRAIEKSGDKEVIEAVRSGEISINQAHKAVTYKPPENKDSVADAHIRHMEFKENKVSTLDETRQDKADRNTIARAAFSDLQSCVCKITSLSALNDVQTFEDMSKVIDQKSRAQMIDSLKRCISILSIATRKLYGGMNE